MSRRSFLLIFVVISTFFMLAGYVLQWMEDDSREHLSPARLELARQEAGDSREGSDNTDPARKMPVDRQARSAVIAFTFDDGYISDYELAFPLFKKYSIKGTSYIIGKYPDSNTPCTMTWAQIREMHDCGWDFGCHTYSHVDLTKLDNDQIYFEMERENIAFLRNGLPLPRSCAFPFGAYNPQVVDALKSFFRQFRKAYYESKFVDLRDTQPWEVDSVSADMQGESRLLSREKLVDKACAEKAILVFRVHCIYREKADDMGRWPVQTSYKLFEQLVEYCVQKGCTFVTMEELMDMCAQSPDG